MKVASRKMRPQEIVEIAIRKFTRAGIELRSVTLEQFKAAISEVVRQLAG